MTILTCDCGYEIYIMDETEATAWQCDRCGQWYDFFGVKVTPPSERKQGKNRFRWSQPGQAKPWKKNKQSRKPFSACSAAAS